MKSSFLRNINLKNKKTWLKKTFFTFDIDWAPDYVLDYLIDFLERKKIKSTLFVTHKFKNLKYLKNNKLFKLEIHPNFNFNLEGDTNIDYKKSIKNLIKIIPDAKVIRSHSLTQNSKILNYCKELGFSHDSNDIVFGSQTKFNPWRHFSGLIKAPITWEDDIHLFLSKGKCKRINKDYISYDSLNILNFHPIALYVNAYNYDHLKFVVKNQKNYFKIKNQINFTKYGIRNCLEDLIHQDFK